MLGYSGGGSGGFSSWRIKGMLEDGGGLESSSSSAKIIGTPFLMKVAWSSMVSLSFRF